MSSSIFYDAGVMEFDVVSGGKTPGEWLAYFDRKVAPLNDLEKEVLLGATEPPTKRVRYRVKIVKPHPSTKVGDVSQFVGLTKSLVRPHWEVACLVANGFLGYPGSMFGFINLITMHEPIQSSMGPTFLGFHLPFQDTEFRQIRIYLEGSSLPDFCRLVFVYRHG